MRVSQVIGIIGILSPNFRPSSRSGRCPKIKTIDTCDGFSDEVSRDACWNTGRANKPGRSVEPDLIATLAASVNRNFTVGVGIPWDNSDHANKEP